MRRLFLAALAAMLYVLAASSAAAHGLQSRLDGYESYDVVRTNPSRPQGIPEVNYQGVKNLVRSEYFWKVWRFVNKREVTEVEKRAWIAQVDADENADYPQCVTFFEIPIETRFTWMSYGERKFSIERRKRYYAFTGQGVRIGPRNYDPKLPRAVDFDLYCGNAVGFIDKLLYKERRTKIITKLVDREVPKPYVVTEVKIVEKHGFFLEHELEREVVTTTRSFPSFGFAPASSAYGQTVGHGETKINPGIWGAYTDQPRREHASHNPPPPAHEPGEAPPPPIVGGPPGPQGPPNPQNPMQDPNWPGGQLGSGTSNGGTPAPVYIQTSPGQQVPYTPPP